VFSGRYGDLAATLAAVLLDREARSAALLVDPSAGRLREPLLKVLHVMRALEYSPRSDKFADTTLHEMMDVVGQEPYDPPSVFGFYLPEFAPAGVIGEAGLVSPEAQLGTAPLMVGFLNALASLIDYGLTSCGYGMGNTDVRFGNRKCGWGHSAQRSLADGLLAYSPSPLLNGNRSAIMEEVSLLLTAGRLSPQSLRVLEDSYSRTLASSDSDTALRHVLKLMMASSDFHATNLNMGKGVTRKAAPIQSSLGRPYKALVVLFLEGGADTDNLLVPHSQCGITDLYADYAAIRKQAALPKASLHQLTSPAGEQPCNMFGVHGSLPVVKQLYDLGDAAFFANIGALVQPMTKQEFQERSKVRPPSLFAHNIMQRSMHTVHAQSSSAPGVLGRIVKALTNGQKPFKSELYSLMGNVKMVDGAGRAPNMVDGRHGVTRLKDYSALHAEIANLTAPESTSLFAETHSTTLEASLLLTELVGDLLDKITLSTTFPPFSEEDRFPVTLEKIAKITKLHSTLNTERDVFIAHLPGFDTRNTLDEKTGALFGQLNKALSLLSTELKAQGLWDNVTILTVSDFGRTLTPNGQGTDHGWAGNHVVLGGAVRGGHILGHFPRSFAEGGDLNIGRGRMLPTSPWESLWKPLAQWMGVQEGELTTVLPNLKNFPKVYSKADLFKLY
jgi:uncharacterized protein (DUF1501 family)